jgi:DMSO/TMAO reductase YedYZ molybdopterin-dependent catalytic subunit
VGALLGCQRGSNIKPGDGKRWSSGNAFPNANASVQPVPGTRPEFTPLKDHYKMFNKPVPPEPVIQDWRLRVNGMVEEPLEISLDDFKRYEPFHAFITLACISNPLGGPWISTTRWTGVSMQKILPSWKLKRQATHLRIDGADGFFECVALETIRADERVMLVYELDGVPLPMDHGFPLRIYIPSRYGMKQPKWIATIEATDHWEPGYSVVNTWDKDAIMETTSIIDTVITSESHEMKTPRSVLVGGIAHAGARGISKVEVMVDDGEWQEAQLRAPLSELTWVLWRYDWPFQEGEHTFSVRTYDGGGALQKEEPSPPYPDGATGIQQKTDKV